MTQVGLVKNNMWAIMLDGYIDNIKEFKKLYCEMLKDDKPISRTSEKTLRNRLCAVNKNNFYESVYLFINFLVQYHRRDYCTIPNGPLFTSIFTIDDSSYSIKKYIEKQSNTKLNDVLPYILNEFPIQPNKNYLQIVTICQPVFDEYKLFCKYRSECMYNWLTKSPFLLKSKRRYKNRSNFKEAWKEILAYFLNGLNIR